MLHWCQPNASLFRVDVLHEQMCVIPQVSSFSRADPERCGSEENNPDGLQNVNPTSLCEDIRTPSGQRENTSMEVRTR